MIEYAGGSEDRLPELMRLWKEAFGDTDDFIRSFFAAAYDPGRCRLALEGGRVRGMLFWFDLELDGRRVAYLYGVATAAEARGQGIAGGLLKNVHSLLADCGYFGVLLMPASEPLSRFYEKRGYRVVSRVDQGQTEARGSASARRIGAEAYMDLRRNYLPRGGLVQTGENTRFLDGLADCYRGDGFLAAVSREEPGRCVEFLGSREKIAGFAGFLGLEKLQWRAPGNGSPFAMGLRLDGEAWTEPVYFGLAFD